MTKSRNINNKKQSADNRRSEKSQNFKIKRCLIRIKRFKEINSIMRKVNNIEQKRTIPNKRLNPIERKSEIRIIKSVSNVTKPINKTLEKIKNNLSATAKHKFSESSDEEISKVSNSIKSSPNQNVKPSPRPVGRPPSNKKLMEKKILEKQQQQQQQQQQVQQQPVIKKVIESKVVEDTPTRSKRTPKPNRRYLNDSLITSFKSDKILRKINGDLSDSVSEPDNFNASSSDVDSDILRESDDSSTAGDEFDAPSKTKIKPNVLNAGKKATDISATIKQKFLTESIKKNKMNLFNKLSQSQKNPALYKQVSIPGKTIILNKYSYSQGSANQSSLSVKNQLVAKSIERSQKPKTQILPTPANVNLIRKRKLNESMQQQQRELIKIPKLSEKSSVKSGFLSDIELNDDDDDDADNTDIEDFIKELTQQKQIKIVKKFSQQVNKQLPSQDNRNISNLTKKPTILNKVLQQPKEKENAIDNKKNNIQQQLSTKKILNKDYETENESLESFPESDKEISRKIENTPKNADSSTLEDFEKMPTFTIVNINDIIGKKGDFLLEKQKNDPLNSENTCASPDSSEENNVSGKRKNNSLASGSTVQRNRRKAMHTNLLSENLEKNKDPPPRTPFPPLRKNAANKSGQLKGSPSENVKLLNNNLILSKSVSSSRRSTLSQKSANKGPPRILNSMVAKKTPPITTFNTKVDTRRSHDLSDSDNESKLLTNNRGRPSKENILKQQLFKQLNDNKLDNNNQQQQQQQQQQRSSAQSSSTPTLIGNKRKLPSEKVIIQRQGNKIIKKITCFETWYVINLPPETFEKENSSMRNTIDIPLIQLANQAKQIDLPNIKWTCKVSLQKCTPSMVTQNSEPYTGEIYDDYINPDELHKYRPTNVMFRRQALHPTPKVPYDRAVIFKNNTFFTNIEGKNVKLIGAPHQIEQLKDIEILLNLVDDFSLKNPFVEQAPYMP